MKKIVSLKRVQKIVKTIKRSGGKVVLAGGCFDLLHLGHLKFLEAAKKQGDILVIALENDKNVRRRKGQDRPINNQQIRAKNLTSLPMVDLLIKLPDLTTDAEYQSLVKIIAPDIIAVTAGDPNLANKQEQAKIIGGKVKVVIDRLSDFSTTKIVKNI